MRILCGPESEGTESSGGAAVADEAPDAIVESQDVNGNPDSGVADEAPEAGSVEGDPDSGQQQIEQSQPETPSFAPGLLFQAWQAGIGADEIGQFANAGELERAINLVNRRAQSSQQKQNSGPQQADEIRIEDIPDLGEDEATPKVIAGWNAMKGMIGKLAAKLETVKGGVSEQRIAAETSRFDTLIAGMPNAKEMFGEGDVSTIDRASPQFANRAKMWQAVGDVRRLAWERKERIGESEVYKRARNLAFGDQIAKATTQALQKNLRAQATQFTVPPTQRKIASEDPKKRAVSNVTATMKKKGVLGR